MTSLNLFITLGILGLDFLIFVLFQWTFGDKRRAIQKKLAAVRQTQQDVLPRPYLVSSHKTGPVTQERLQKVRERMSGGVREKKLA
ncbi:MAG TPA: hypothetical protein VMH20_01445 [Verrucomicrobiae bacterium]|jgi:hypothetical protein|nr:hypothetical protein [Verrucomicrobiae bacterium]